MNRGKRLISVILALLFVVALIPVFALSINAQEDAMTAINNAFSDKKKGAQSLSSDGYIGIPVELSVYFDSANHTVTSGFDGTPVVLYVVNANVERIGTESDVTIIQSMLERGYVVMTVDYKSNPLAASPSLDTSLQYIRQGVQNRSYVKSFFPSGTYYENHVVPAGYNLTLNAVFWEADKHGADGTFDKIIENWNNDFKGTKGSSLVKWVHSDGSRKKVANASDGSAPVWYNSNGAVDANGQYTRVKWTVAETITDCVNPDGSPIDLNLYMNIIYPTSPAREVPVMCIASSSGHLSRTTENVTRPHHNGFLLGGYAFVEFDYLYVPMARDNSFGYYDGKTSSGSVSGDQMTYSVHLYSDKEINTAAMRYIRYLALSDAKYSFKSDAIGVYGNSKGGWMTFLGEAVLNAPLVDKSDYQTAAEHESAISHRITSFWETRNFENHHGETRYENGITETYTKDGATIDGGELQPWLTYNGEEILSGANFIYASNGSNEEDVTAGHAPIFVGVHLEDTYNAAYGNSSTFVNLCRTLDIPSMFFEVPLGHTVVVGEDLNYGVDTYGALFDFAGYYLKGDAVKVVWATPLNGSGNASLTGDIKIKFTGPVSNSEIEKVLVTDALGNIVSGSWTPLYGKTEWTFSPSAMQGDTTYTVTVPASLSGDNGRAMGDEYRTSFKTGSAAAVSADGLWDNLAEFTVPELPAGAEGYKLRFYVSNDAANTVNVCLCENRADKSGSFVSAVNLKGAGYYEVDITDSVKDKVGETVYFLMKPVNAPTVKTRYSADFSTSAAGCGNTVYSAVSVENGTLKTYIKPNNGKYVNHVFYDNPTVLFMQSTAINGGRAVTDSDYGRKFTVSFKVYCEKERVIQVRLNSCTSSSEEIIDYDMNIYNFYTVPGEWKTFSFDYVVYDTDYGTIGNHKKTLSVGASADGNNEGAIYFDDLTVTETLTEVTVTEADIVMHISGTDRCLDEKGEKPVSVYSADGTIVASYSSIGDALSNYKHGQIVKLNSDYTLKYADNWSQFSYYGGADGEGGHKFVIDLGGYTVTSKNSNSLIWLNAKTPMGEKWIEKTEITLKNGRVLLKDTPLVFLSATDLSAYGKIFNVSLENLELELLPNAKVKSLVCSTNITSEAGIALNIDMKDCVIRHSAENSNAPTLTVFSVAKKGANISYKVLGGEIVLDSAKRVVIAEDPTRVSFIKDEHGVYTVLKTPAGQPRVNYSVISSKDTTYIPIEMNTDLGTGKAVFMPTAVNGGVATYSLIPAAYADAEKYPFLLLNKYGAFVTATSALYGQNSNESAIGCAKELLKSNEYDAASGGYGTDAKEAYIYLRRDYTLSAGESFENIAQIQNTVTLDLGTSTLTARSDAPLIKAHAKPWAGSGDALIFPTELVIKNGKIILSDASLFEMQAWEARSDVSVKDKEMKFVLDGVTLKVAKDGGVSSLLTSFNPHNATADAETRFSVVLNGCTLDLSEKVDGSTVTLFNASHAKMAVDFKVNGCRILAENSSAFTVKNVNGENTQNNVVFGFAGGSLLRISLAENGAQIDTGAEYPTVLGALKPVKYTPTGEYRLCAHGYSGDCDTVCNLCENARTAVKSHSYSSDCDGICNACGEAREDGAAHTFDKLESDSVAHWYACSDCGAEKPESYEAHRGGHTCTAEKLCAVCSYRYATLSPTSEHRLSYSHNGTQHWQKCDDCGFESERSEHSFTYITTVEPTPTEDGERIGTCSDCGFETNETLLATGEEKPLPIGLIIGVTVASVSLLFAVFGLVWWRKRI